MKEDSFEIVIHIYGGRSLVLGRWVALALMFQVSVRYLGRAGFVSSWTGLHGLILRSAKSCASSLSLFFFFSLPLSFLSFSPFFSLFSSSFFLTYNRSKNRRGGGPAGG